MADSYTDNQPRCRRCDRLLEWYGNLQNGYYYRCPDCNDVILYE